ncbi:S-adenosyl-L-methionine-dependent methyltransferase [Aspergillus caelatus]|uniref:S-adenosyl-L-methionine-dependent methyltransferase n=3 Tax=Aspergillus subgen. Circumdati TaxID=2720871 RepID=A0A5N7A984_9EURO|nr:uncharacterized protein ANOM_007968 [Aspergillus nomiae NRRL 13137]XP_031929512.1 S-adenosyl-L-methionine-dependent methyltransferase [Aspergillus caelatus]KAE8421209.1 S-adenosyl-L-methionine-dependent methyltransferase [Aspergillus pseudocaelatus]WNO13878.1 MST-FP2004_9353 [Aspergillus nomiae]KAE8366431.1 S-adenosyl-L-methionine-dependent methyltransferase [Aspergillus caelatus]KNG84535.1 hypothetical protein ANOM_007968 [Aspergillus nomiae NRRL 13137]
MDNFMDMTKKAGHTAELERLVALHETYYDAMDGKLVLAPLDLQEPGKKILDCGTADGIWLRDVRKSAPAEHQYFGSDIEPELFPEQPDGITYFPQSFSEPWADEHKDAFDLVHVRGSLAGSSPKRPVDVVKGLASVTKPGGWVQLMELNAFSAPSNGPAMTDFARMASEIWAGIKVGDFANELKSMLEEVGLQNVQEKRVIVSLGKQAKPELHAKSIHGVTGPIRPLTSVARSVPNSFTDEQLSSLPDRVREELETEGGRVEMVVAWGQRV